MSIEVRGNLPFVRVGRPRDRDLYRAHGRVHALFVSWQCAKCSLPPSDLTVSAAQLPYAAHDKNRSADADVRESAPFYVLTDVQEDPPSLL